MLLSISTAHDACSAALCRGGEIVAERHELIGRGHDSRLAPLVAELLHEAAGEALGAIWVDVGPGSFTGIRVGIAMAHGLAIARKAGVHGVASDRIVAAACFAADRTLRQVLVALPGRPGEILVRTHGREGPVGQPERTDTAAFVAMARSAEAIAGAGADTTGLPLPNLHPNAPRAADIRNLRAADLLPPVPGFLDI